MKVEKTYKMEKNSDSLLHLQKILDSATFANKEVQKSLLSFLFSSANEGKALREIDIAFDFFKRGDTFQPGEDTIVRVSIYKLRALLEKYYQNEGAEDELIFDLPKGSYSLRVVKKGEGKKRPVRKIPKKKIVYLILFVSVIINLIFLINTEWKSGIKKNPVWTDYLISELPVSITLGDPFFFRATQDSTDEGIVVRDIKINSADDLQKVDMGKYLDKSMKIGMLDYPYLSTNNIRPLPDIINVFSKAGIDVRLQTLSETNIEDIKRSNQVFIGNINSFGFFNKFLEKTSIRLKTNPREIIIDKGTDSLVLSVPEKIHGYYVDYAFMAKVPGMNNTIISLLGDFHASGIKGLSDFITNEASISKLKKEIVGKHGKFPEFFEMVVKVTSYDYYDFKTELIYFNPINQK